jgi:hypothetical protein
MLAFALAHPGLGPRRVAAELRRPKWGAIAVSANGVWCCLRRHGLDTRARRLSLVAGYRAPYEPPREPRPERHVAAARPGELVGGDCFYVGRVHGTRGVVVAADRDRRLLFLRLGRPGQLPEGEPNPMQTSRSSVCRVARELRAAGLRLERVLNGQEFRAARYRRAIAVTAPGLAASAPAAHTRTAPSRRCTRRSSTSADAPPPPATSTSASKDCAASSAAT